MGTEVLKSHFPIHSKNQLSTIMTNTITVATYQRLGYSFPLSLLTFFFSLWSCGKFSTIVLLMRYSPPSFFRFLCNIICYLSITIFHYSLTESYLLNIFMEFIPSYCLIYFCLHVSFLISIVYNYLLHNFRYPSLGGILSIQQLLPYCSMPQNCCSGCVGRDHYVMGGDIIMVHGWGATVW